MTKARVARAEARHEPVSVELRHSGPASEACANHRRNKITLRFLAKQQCYKSLTCFEVKKCDYAHIRTGKEAVPNVVSKK